MTRSPVVYHQWNRSRGEVARLILEKFNGKYLLQLRVFHLDEKGELKPTRHGLTIPYEQLKPLRKALRKAEEALAKESESKE
jgi:Transcriptional Coactivator p15 (PC4)